MLSDSILCPVIRSVREKIGVNFSRREKVVILKREQRLEKSMEEQKEKEPIAVSTQNLRSSLQYQQVDDSRMNQESPQRPRSSSPRHRSRSRRSNHNNHNNGKENDEVSQLRAEIAELRETVKELAAIVQALAPLLHQDDHNENNTEETSNMEYDQ
jgi:hypothetical protein